MRPHLAAGLPFSRRRGAHAKSEEYNLWADEASPEGSAFAVAGKVRAVANFSERRTAEGRRTYIVLPRWS